MYGNGKCLLHFHENWTGLCLLFELTILDIFWGDLGRQKRKEKNGGKC